MIEVLMHTYIGTGLFLAGTAWQKKKNELDGFQDYFVATFSCTLIVFFWAVVLLLFQLANDKEK